MTTPPGQSWYRHTPAPEKFFWAHVTKTRKCWHWTGGLTWDGYGYIYVRELGHTVGAHRFAYELLVGPIPEGLSIDHLCRVHHCVNPKHLEPCTIRENIQRGFAARARDKARKVRRDRWRQWFTL